MFNQLAKTRSLPTVVHELEVRKNNYIQIHSIINCKVALDFMKKIIKHKLFFLIENKVDLRYI